MGSYVGILYWLFNVIFDSFDNKIGCFVLEVEFFVVGDVLGEVKEVFECFVSCILC